MRIRVQPPCWSVIRWQLCGWKDVGWIELFSLAPNATAGGCSDGAAGAAELGNVARTSAAEAATAANRTLRETWLMRIRVSPPSRRSQHCRAKSSREQPVGVREADASLRVV